MSSITISLVLSRITMKFLESTVIVVADGTRGWERGRGSDPSFFEFRGVGINRVDDTAPVNLHVG